MTRPAATPTTTVRTSSPAPGWWGGIIVDSGGTASLDHADIRYGGSTGRRNLWVNGGDDLTLTNSVIQFSGTDGIEINNSTGNHTLTDNQINNNGGVGIALINADGMIEISGNAFADNGIGIDVNGTALATQNTQITNNTINGGTRGIRLAVPDASPSISGNTIDGTSLAPLAVAGGNIDETTSWDADETYFVESNINVLASGGLTLPAGAVVKVQNRNTISVSGSLTVTGTTADPVVLTDYRDDSVGGDTNGDGSASSPAPGWWGGIIVDSGGTASLDHADIRYGGSTGRRNLWVNGGDDLTLTNSVIQFSGTDGIEINNSTGNHTLTDNQINNNGGDGLALINADGMIEISGNAFADNGIGIDVNGTALATQNTQITNNTINGGTRGIRLAVPDASPSISGNTIDGTSLAPLAVAGGNIDENTSWDADETYFVESNINVLASGGLTLPAGAVVKVQNRDTISVSGSLTVTGTTADPVVLTDYRDDSVGGDTNGDGSASSPAPGWWGGIIVDSGGTASLDHADIRYGGSTGRRNLWVNGGDDLTLTNSVIQFSGTDGIEINNSTGNHTLTGNQINNNGGDGLALINADGMIEISGNAFADNGIGIDVNGTALATQNTQITNNTINGGTRGIRLAVPDASPSISGNTIDGTSLAPLAVAGGNIDETTSWDADETYFVESNINVLAGGGLTLPAGAVVKVQNRNTISVSGSLTVTGTTADPVVLTDYRDDSVGGDTNGDESANSPAPGWWGGIIVDSGGTASLDHADIRYGGSTGRRNLWVNGGDDLTLTNSVIQFSGTDGIEINNSTGNHTLTDNQINNNGGVGIALLDADGAIEISDNVMEQNTANGVKIEESSPAVLDNEITDNGVAGVFVTGAAATPELFGNLIANNNIGVDATSDANPLIGGSLASGNDILGNTDFGVRNQSTETTIDARYNWWGDETGPQHPSLNPDGIGDEVSDNVLFDPWLGASALQPAANIAIEPALVDFHPQFPGNSSDAESVTVENRGTAPLNVGQLTLAGDHPGDFEILTDEVSETAIEPLESGAVDIRFTPTEIGSRSAVLEVPSDDPDNPLVEIELFGEGLSDEIFADDFDASL